MKTPTSHLTASRKKRVRPSRSKRRRPQSKANRLDILDALHERCARVEMVAGLLEACDDPHSLSPELAAHAGYFIEEELRQVRKLLTEFEGGTR